MSPRKRFRRGRAEASSAAGPAAAPTTLQPSQATTTSQVSSSSATSEPSTSTTPATSRREPDKGMPPPPLPQLSSSNKTDGSNKSDQQGYKTIHKTKSWYGSLTRKSTASTSLQRETIVGSPLKAGSTPDFHRYDLKKNGETASLSGGSQASVNALSKLHETDTETNVDASVARNDTSVMKAQADQVKTREGLGAREESDGIAAPGTGADMGANTDGTMANAPPAADTQQQPSGWLGGWFSRNPVPADQSAGARDAPIVSSQSEPAPDPPTQVATASTSEVESPPITSSQQPAASWFNIFWSAKTEPEGCSEESTKAAEASTQPAPEDASVEGPVLSDPEPASKPSAGSTWAFWSRDAPKSPGQQPPGPETGELAVVGDRSERRPLRANSKDMGGDEQLKEEPSRGQSIKAKQSKDKLSKKTKKTKPQSLDLNKTPSRPVTPQSDATSTKIESPSKGKTKTPTTATKSAPPNLLLPSFKDTYRMKESPSILKQITALLLRAQQAPAKHVFLKNEAPRIRKAIAIGVHGLFPATFLRPMIGQPTGTSIKFANHCAEGIRRWAESHGCGDCEIEKVALEGEGKIEARVQNLWTLLQNWMDHIRQADLVVIACHSQGVPVSMMLLEKLVDSGAIGNAKVGVCAMAGVSLGPFAEYKSSMGILMGTAAELWEFANSESEVSRRYEAALKKTLEYGVRITYVGSIDDQLVPMESAIYSPASHPYIYRAVFIDGRLHASDFITHLVGFACKLRNMGVSDHGLIRELSIPLAGSLYGGEGHSRLYDDDQVYDLAISHTLETTDAGSVPCEIARYEGLAQPNPYVLPWIMRGLLEEDFVKTELSTETDQLLKRFDDWKPTTKPLQNVKYRLEAVRSRL